MLLYGVLQRGALILNYTEKKLLQIGRYFLVKMNFGYNFRAWVSFHTAKLRS